jgi:hypothetical protein
MTQLPTIAGRQPVVKQVDFGRQPHHGLWYIIHANDPTCMRHLRTDGKWHNGTGSYEEGYWPTEAAALAFCREVAGREAGVTNDGRALPAGEPDLPPCAGCGLRELHKKCVAHGTEAYMNQEHPAWGDSYRLELLKDVAALRQQRDDYRTRLRLAIINLRHASPKFKRHEHWSNAGWLFGLGSTSASKLCEELGIDPSGRDDETP